MKRILALTFLAIFQFFPHFSWGQLVIEENNLAFWGSTDLYGKYKFIISNPENYNLKFNSEKKSVEGTAKVEHFYKDINAEVDIWIGIGHRGTDEMKRNPFTKTGDFFNPAQSISGIQSIYDIYSIGFFIDKERFLFVNAQVYLPGDANKKFNELTPDERIECNRILLATWKNELEKMTGFFKKNLNLFPVKEGDGQQGESGKPNKENTEQENLHETVSASGWMKIVGGATALSLVVAAAAKILRSRKKTGASDNTTPRKKNDKKERNKKDDFIYVLQLSKDILDLTTNQSDKFVVTAWRVDDKGNRELASDAVIKITCQDKAIKILSTLGNGQRVVTVSQVSSSGLAEIPIRISAMAGGRQFTAQVLAELQQILTLIVDTPAPLTFIEGQKYSEAVYEKERDGKSGQWVFKPFYIWFTDSPNPEIDPDRTQPVKPPFTPVFKINAEPEWLEISEPKVFSENVWKVEVKTSSRMVSEKKWILEDGKIKINITVERGMLTKK